MYQEGEEKLRLATEPLDTNMKRKSGPGLGLSDRRKLKNVGKEEQDRSESMSVTSSTPSSSVVGAEEQEKMMVLSAEARQALIQMQRFDRFIYVMESEKRLKGPIEKELKRLERIKNSGNKAMKNTYFDNQLTITCLFNHMKNMYEMNRDLGEIVVLKAEIQALQQKIIDQNVKYNKDIKEASSAARGKFAQQSQQLKQILKFHENIISALRETNFDRSKKKIEVEIKKATQDRKDLLELISNLISRASAETSAGIIDTFTITIDKITQDQGDIAKNIAYLDKERKALEKQLSDPRTDEAKKKVLEQLLDTVLYLTSIYGLAKSGGSQTQIVSPQTKIQKSEQTSGVDKKLLRDLQAQLKALEQQGNTWVIEFQTLTTRLQNDENITLDINKQRKLLNMKKNMNPTVSNFSQLALNILDVSSKKLKEQNQSSNNEKDRLNQIDRLTKTNTALEKQIQQLRDQVAKTSKVNTKQPNVEAEWTRLITIIDQAFKKRQQNSPQAQNEIIKARKAIEQNRKKFPAEFHNLLDTIQYLISIVIDSDQNMKVIDQENQKKAQLEGKQVSNLDVFSKALEKLITSSDIINDGYINKLKKNLETTFNKLQKQEETPLLNLYLGNLDNTWKVIELLEKVHQLSKEVTKGKGEVDSKKQQVDTLRDQLKVKQQDLKSKQQDLKAKDQQLKSSRQQFGNLQRKLKDYERKLQDYEKKDNNKKVEFEDARKDKQRIQTLQRQLQDNQRQTDNIIAQYEKDIKKLTNQSQNNSNNKELQRQNSELRKTIDTLNRSVNDGKNNNKEADRLKRQIDQLKNIQNAQQQATKLKNEEIQNLKRKVKDLERAKNEVKYVETKIESSSQGSEYWRQRYQASKLQNEVLRQELASLERRFDQVSINTSNNFHTINIIKPQNSSSSSDTQVNKLKASLANQQALVLSKNLQIQHYQSNQASFKSRIQNLNKQLRTAQLNFGNTQQSNVKQQISQLVNENAKLQQQIISVKQQLNSTIDNLIFVDGENFKINESIKQEAEKYKLLEQRYSALENSVKSGLQVSKLRDQKIDLQNKYEDLKREMDLLAIELQSYRDGTKKTSGRGSLRLPGTPKGNKIVSGSVEWTTTSQVFNTQSGRSQTKSQISLNYNGEKGNQSDIFGNRVLKLENQNRALVERLNVLSVFNSSMSEVNQFFPDNLNKMIENLIRFMIDFQGLTQDLLIDTELLTQIQSCLQSRDYVKYFQLSQEYLRNAITTLLINKNKIVTIQTQQIVSQNILNKGDLDVDVGSLQNLFKLYLKAKDPQLLGQIREIMILRD